MPDAKFTSDADTTPLAFDEPSAVQAALEKRIETLTDELRQRIARVEDLQRQLQHLQNISYSGVGKDAAEKALQYDLLMQTKTMRLLAAPRAAYGRARTVVAGRRAGH